MTAITLHLMVEHTNGSRICLICLESLDRPDTDDWWLDNTWVSHDYDYVRSLTDDMESELVPCCDRVTP